MSRSRKPPKLAPESLPYRPCVGVMLVNDAGRVWIGDRADTGAPAWQMPQGGIDKGEDPRRAAFREMAEEIGTDKAEVIAETDDWLRYDLPPHLIGVAWKGRYRGQEQKWFLMRFLGRDADIDLTAHAPEFHRWTWEEPERLPDLIVPFKRALYESVLAAFAPHLTTIRNR